MPTLNTYAAPQIATVATVAAHPVFPSQLPPPVAAAPNLTAATAIDIGTALPYTTQQNVNFGGVTQTVWYKYTAQAGDTVIGVFGFGDLTIYKPTVLVFSPDGATVYLGTVAGTNVPIQFPVIVGNTYWLRFTSSGGNKSTAMLLLSVRRAPKNPAPSGSILIVDDTTGFAASLLSALTGDVLQFRTPFAVSENGDVLNTGELCVQNTGATPATVNFYDKTLGLVLASALPFAGVVSTNKTSLFYIGDPGGGPVKAKVTTATTAGIQGVTTWTFASAGLTGIAPSPDESTLYYAGNGGSINAPVKRWDLVNDVGLTDLVAGIALYATNDIVVLNDGTLLVLYYRAATGAGQVKHYSTTGAVLNTYTLPTAVATRPRMCRAIDDPTSFWAFINIAGGLAEFQNIKVSDGTVLTDVSLVAYEGGTYQGAAVAAPANFFGPSQSCPIIIIRNAINAGSSGPGGGAAGGGAAAPCPDIT